MPIACPSLIGGQYPELCAAVDHYCERTGSGVDAEPLNALTNAAFLVAAWGAWRFLSRHPSRSAHGLVVALIATMVLVGVGSFLFHTVATRWAEWGDVLPIMLFMLLYLWLVLTLFFGWPIWLKVMENGTVGEARTRSFLIDRFWVLLERSVDTDGADFLITTPCA